MYLAAFGCAVPEKAAEGPDRAPQGVSDARRDLDEARRLLDRGNYQLSLMVSERVLTGPAGLAHGDEALFIMGLVFAHPGNQNRDYQRSVAFFKRLVREFPYSPLKEQARTWTEVLEENMKLKRASSEALQEIARLKQIIEQSKKVDIEIEEKKREEKR
ncbi:MAG: hypothetical protein A4E60_00663 [Syntrophorhabdus sp. PtaB.Bin047]|jgi:hypothetical protein|nr:MAG: hypothetical protein A4E60_00663 [Syntrophorhabdus sp. PtaB.Bin047]